MTPIVRSLVLAITAPALVAGCLEVSGSGEDEELEDVYAGSVSRIIAHEVYVRWAPGSATIDYFLTGDEVDMHGTARSGLWVCVTGTTRYGQRHTGWILRSTVARASGDVYEGTGRCKYGPDDLAKFEVTFKNCRIRARGAFRRGPRSDAERIKGPRAPDGFLDPAEGRTCLALASDSQGGTRAAAGDYVWSAWRPDTDPDSNHAPGRTGWFRKDLLDCGAGACSNDVGAIGPTTGGSDSCGDGTCDGDEDDQSCAADCGCTALDVCAGPAPSGCYCDGTCGASGDCCADIAVCIE